MARITITISDELEDRLREYIFHKYGWKKGNLSKVIEMAIKEFLEKEEESEGK